MLRSTPFSIPMKSLFQQYATKKNLIVLLILTVLCNISLALYFGSFEKPILDTHIYYTATEAYEVIGSYEAYHRQRYVFGTLLLDFIYPVIYCLMLSVALYRIVHKVELALLPLLILPIDYLENISLILMVSKLPERNEMLASIVGVFTLIKWLMVIGTLLGIIVLLLYKRFKSKREKDSLTEIP